MSDRLAYLNQLLEKASILEAVNMKYGLDVHENLPTNNHLDELALRLYYLLLK